MKKVFMFAAMFAAVALVACGGEQAKEDKAAEAEAPVAEEVVEAPAAEEAAK